MKSVRKFLKEFRKKKCNFTGIKSFTSLVFGYVVGNPQLNKDQRQLLGRWLYGMKDPREMTIHRAVQIARWINIHVNGFQGNPEWIVFGEISD